MANNYYPTPQSELLPNFRRTPPPEVLQAQIRQMWNSWFPQSNNNGQGAYQPAIYQSSAYQSPIQTPPPEILQAQAMQYAKPLATWLGGQALENAAIYGATGKTLGQHLTSGINRALNSPQALSTIAAIQATQAGAPIVNGIRNFANSPAGKNTGNLFQKIIDWSF